MSDSEDDRQQQGSNEQRQRQQQREESEMRGGEAESGPTHNRLNMSCPTAKMTGSSKVATYVRGGRHLRDSVAARCHT